MNQTVQRFLAVEALGFVLAALTHAGILTTGYEDAAAATAESVIAAVLLAGLVATWLMPARASMAGVVAQAFGLLGTSIGLFFVVAGIGPTTLPDVVFHVGILLLLFWGLVVAARGDRPQEATRLAMINVVMWLARGTAILQLALGIAFWTGNLVVAIPFHMFNGVLFVLLLFALAGLAASWRLSALGVAWGVVVVAFGMTQAQILPGDWHWVVKVAHLAVGLVAMGLAERLAQAARGRLTFASAAVPAAST